MLKGIAIASNVVITAGLAVLAQGPLVSEEGPWRIVLEQQLKAEKGCALNEVLTYQEIPLGDSLGQDGRASCFDGREFTFSRQRKHQAFTIRACEPAVC
ncbi:MAG: hypothetical protein AB7S70_01570 [Hyphomicrobium sp.]|uniref:hypothetical protein n=1 Tax=Hyphomicrobium sp. TaxID=82 RepID=UPI003D0AFD6C